MTDQTRERSGCEPIRIHTEDPSTASTAENHLRDSPDAPKPNLMSSIKIKEEAITDDDSSDIGDEERGCTNGTSTDQEQRQETVDDVGIEKIADVVATKSELAFVAGQERPTCTGCGRSYKNDKNLKKHVRICEKSNYEIVKFKCFHCSHETKRKYHLDEHIRRVHPIRPIGRSTCIACGKSFKHQFSLKKHTRFCDKLNNEIVKHKCQFCYYQTKWKNALTKHIRRVHPVEDIGRSTCTACGKSFKHEESLKAHLRFCEKSNDNIMKFKCFFCNHKTKWKYCLKSHIIRVHPVDAIENSTCSACGKYCRNKYSLNAHIRFCEKSSDRIMKFKCFYCSHKTKWKYTLKAHINRVHPLEPIERSTCPACGKSYKNKDSLKEHIRFCDKSNDDIVKFKCFHCLYETKRTNDLTRHVARVHPAGPIELAICPACGNSFKNKESLKRHLRICAKSKQMNSVLN